MTVDLIHDKKYKKGIHYPKRIIMLISQAGTAAPTIDELLYTDFPLVTLTPNYSFLGSYYFTSSSPIFTPLKTTGIVYMRSVNYYVVYTVEAIDATTLYLESFNSGFGSPMDDLIASQVLEILFF